MRLDQHKCVLLTTYRRNGAPVSTPVWIVSLGTHKVGFYTGSFTGKVKRLRHTPRVMLQPCNYRGVVKPGTAPIEATAEIVTGPEHDRIVALAKQKYGFLFRLSKTLTTLAFRVKGQKITYADRGVVITLPPDDGTEAPAPHAQAQAT